jgi:hypothetical protein
MYFRIFAEVLSDVQGMAVPQVLAGRRLDVLWHSAPRISLVPVESSTE